MVTDLRSDTITRPTAGMLQAMMKAATGDDVYKEDPAVNELEEKAAGFFGAETALFFPSGTMANQTAIKLHTQPGDQLIADKQAHIFNFEAGGVSFNSGVSCKLIGGKRGIITAAEVENAVNPHDFYHSPRTRLVCLENTTNMGGGACYDLPEIQEIKRVCEKHNLGFHLDGARLWNALLAKKQNPKAFGAVFDTISVCLSKGLGAPVGSVLLGKKEIMSDAIRIRKILGGGMRQAGYLAAAGSYAMDHHLQRLEEDHRRAAEIAEVLKNCSFVKHVIPAETNIVIFCLKDHLNDAEFLQKLHDDKIRISSMGSRKLRIVTHLDYTESMHDRFLDLLKKYNDL